MKVRLGIWAGLAQISPPPNLPHQGGGNKNLPSLGGRGKGRVYKAAIVIGLLDKTGLPKLEAHLLNFKGNLYGKKVTVSLGKYIRPFKKFKSEPELKKQIRKDILLIRKITYGK